MVPLALLALTLPARAQTVFELHENKFSPEQDVELGREAAADVRRQLPMLNDRASDAFVQELGDRLIRAIPGEYRQPAFRYTFDVVNLKEINAFALPGGPMFLHRGMIEAARTEGQVAGVMAHELAHVILRHGTAQATAGQKFQLGAIAGQVLGSILGGRTGAIVAQGSQFGLSAYFMKYSREYEREADLFGAQLMARAGYDPREMAAMFQTIERQGGSRGPEWLSDHPNPGNRIEAINREAQSLDVARRETSGDLPAVHARLRQLPPAPTMQQVARAQQEQQRGGTVGANSRAMRVEPPSRELRAYQPGDFLRLSVPSNWQQIDAGNTVMYAPEGGVGRGANGASAFTHGIEIGVTRAQGNNLQQQTEALIQGFARTNPQLRRRGGYSRTSMGGRQGLSTTLTNVSEATGEAEAVNVSTVPLRDGSVLYMIGVAPVSEADTYLNTFGRIRQTIRIQD